MMMNNNSKKRKLPAVMRWSSLVLLLFVAATTHAALNISNAEQQILKKAGINADDYEEGRFQVENGHIRKVYLYNCGLTKLPLALVELPYVEIIDLYDNQIAGDIGELTQAYIDTNPTVGQNLRILNLNNNKLTGDVGPLVGLLDPVPTIEYLYIRDNSIADISTLPEKEDFWVDLDNQRYDLVIDFNPDEMTPANLMAQLPRATLYSMWDRNFFDYVTVEGYIDNNNMFDIYESWESFSVWTADGLRLQNGGVYDARCCNAYFRLRVFFTMGDVNFSGTVDEDDLSSTIDYIQDNNAWSFNFTAADLNGDGNVDLLDYVTLQHRVFGTTPTATQAGTNTMAMPDLLFNSEVKLLPVSINNANDIVALQFDLVLPDGIWGYLWDENIADRVHDYDYTQYNEVGREDGKVIIRYVIYSPTGESILSGHSGEIAKLHLTRYMERDYPSMQLEVRNVVFATTDGKNVFTSAQLGWLNFDTTVDAAEWTALQRANVQRVNSDGETVPMWDFSGGPATAKNLTGITIEDGHITKIELTSRNLTGGFPFALTELPYLKELRVYSNPLLTGDIGEQTEAFKATNPTVSETLAQIDIDNCDFYGNIGPMLALYPALTDVWAQNNRLTGITPLPPASIYLRIGGQQLDDVVIDCNAATMTTETFLAQLPDVVRLDGTKLTDELHIVCYRENKNVFDVRTTWDHKFEFWTNGTFYKNGETFHAEGGKGKYNLRLIWTMGDADFDGTIDVADVQKLARCIGYNDFGGWGRVNASASDLNGDSILNVIDVVRLVNIVMAQQPQALPAYTENAEVSLSCTADGLLVINAARPVGAFDILIGGSSNIELSEQMEAAGMTCTMQQQNGSLHLIGYSMGDSTLPAGQTVIGRLAGSSNILKGATIVDKDAQRMAIQRGTTTGITKKTATEHKAEVYSLPLGHGHAISIDADGNKTIMKK